MNKDIAWKADMLKNFSKQDRLLMKKYNRLAIACISNHIPYSFINRCYKRYEKWCKSNNIPCVKDIFQLAIKVVIIAKEEGYVFPKYSRGAEACHIAKVSGFTKYLSLYK